MFENLFNPVNLAVVAAAAAGAAANGYRTKTRTGAAVGAAAGAAGAVAYFKLIASGRYLSFVTVQSGSTGLAAKKVQERINMHGYGPVPEDGTIGNDTVEAIKRFQSARGLTSDGVVNFDTWSALTSRPPRASGAYELSDVIGVMKKKGYTVYEDGTWNIVGIRSRAISTNTFDDVMYLFRKKGSDWELSVYPITTDPGTYWLKNPMNSMGAGSMAEGQYKDTYVIGTHAGKYTALVQRAGKIKAYRDRDKDGQFKYDPSTIREGMYGMNIHRSSLSGESKTVDKWSAGCQVFGRVRDFNEFLERMKASGKSKFTYTLLHQDDFV